MIGVDWGTSSFRAFRLSGSGAILDRMAAPCGILQVAAGGFAKALRESVGVWFDDGEDRVLLSGMVGSRQGWAEAAYLPCPAGAAELSAALTDIAFDGAQVKLVPGLIGQDAAGVPEVMRGEETQIVGMLARLGDAGIVCLPGSHSKWAAIRDGRITGFTTHMTGEAFAALRGHTILGRMMQDGPTDPAAFEQGVARAAEPGGLLHHAFGVRTLCLTGRMAESASASYLSGLLIGHEVGAAMTPGDVVHLVGAPALVALYARAIAARSGQPVVQDSEAAAAGLALIGASAEWT